MFVKMKDHILEDSQLPHLLLVLPYNISPQRLFMLPLWHLPFSLMYVIDAEKLKA